MIRLFVALDLPPDVRAELARLCAGVPGAKWLAPETFHLTLRFIGNVDGRLYGDIVDGLGHVRQGGFAVRLAGVGQFGQKRQAELLWAGVEPSADLARLAQKVETALQCQGIEAERRKFHPHVTLARLKHTPAMRVGAFLAAHSLYRSEPIPVSAFVLYSSHLGRAGAIHQVEASYPLGPA